MAESKEKLFDQFPPVSTQEWKEKAPEKVGIKGWDAVCKRIATWAIFKDKESGVEFMALNTPWINFTWSGDAVWAIEEADAVGVELDYTEMCIRDRDRRDAVPTVPTVPINLTFTPLKFTFTRPNRTDVYKRQSCGWPFSGTEAEQRQ